VYILNFQVACTECNGMSTATIFVLDQVIKLSDYGMPKAVNACACLLDAKV
jgi:hypothetical protein